MSQSDSNRTATSWTRHLFYRRESWRTTWKLRLSLLAFIVILVPVTRGWWAPAIAGSLVCTEQTEKSDAFLLENFDPDYLVFERTTTLQRAGAATTAFVPVQKDGGTGDPNMISAGVANLMAKVSWLQSMEFIPIREEEPISLNAARQIRDVLVSRNVKSIIVVTPGFRSRRSFLVYDSVLRPAGIRVGCAPILGTKRKDNWTHTWHGIQDVAEQFVKLQYYQLWVLRNIR
jgi:hypothetical protein